MSIKNPINFGTDGWRAIIAQDFTFDNVRVCAQGVADYLKDTRRIGDGLVIGYDTRFASEDFAAAAAEVVAGNGIRVYLCARATPTPVISFGIRAHKAAGGIIITASHNAGIWNGFKYKTADGTSAPTEVIAELEKNIARIFPSGKIDHMPLARARQEGMVASIDLASAYFEHVKNFIDLDALWRANLRVVIDPMFGAGAGYLKTLLSGGGILHVVEINGERNPLFPGMQRPEPIAVNLEKLSASVCAEKAGVGIATDGDADRVGIVSENGEFLNQLQVYALLCLYLLEVRGERGAIVKTITSSNMLFRLGELFKVPVFETPVGFKYVAPIMMRENALIGGEESGGYAFRGHAPERDGILAGLYFLDLLVRTGKTPSQLLAYLYSKVGPHYYERVDIEFPAAERQAIIQRVGDNQPVSIEGIRVVKIETIDGFRFHLADGAWLLVRFSGTEPLLRIYAESSSLAQTRRLLEAGRKLTGL